MIDVSTFAPEPTKADREFVRELRTLFDLAGPVTSLLVEDLAAARVARYAGIKSIRAHEAYSRECRVVTTCIHHTDAERRAVAQACACCLAQALANPHA